VVDGVMSDSLQVQTFTYYMYTAKANQYKQSKTDQQKPDHCFTIELMTISGC